MAAVTPVDTSPAGTLRRAAERLRQEITAVEADLRDNTYWGGEQRPIDAYARGVDDGLGGPAGKYAATMGPAVGLLLAELFVDAAENVEQNGNVLLSATDEAAHALALVVLGEQR